MTVLFLSHLLHKISLQKNPLTLVPPTDTFHSIKCFPPNGCWRNCYGPATQSTNFGIEQQWHLFITWGNKALSWGNLHFEMSAVHSALLPEGSFFETRCLATGRLPTRLSQLEVVRSRHPGRYPKLASPTLSHPAFEPLTEHHAFSTGLFDAALPHRYPRGQDDVVSVPSSPTSQPELRASDRFDFTSSGTPTPSRISSGIMRSPMR